MITALVPIALDVRMHAYAPYSNYFVGAAIATDVGVFSGCNVENASYGLCNCAERTAVFSAVAAGAKTVTAVVVATHNGGSPCGACRQVLAEFADPSCPVLCIDESGAAVLTTTVGELLPAAFTPRNLTS